MEVLDNNFESNLENVSEEMLKYVGITNMDFRTALSEDDLEEVKRMLCSINTLMQVTFKDGVRVKDIENIKHVLELSPMCNDSKVEKMILRSNTPEEVKELLAMPFLNPDTWHLSYQIKDGTYMITTLPNYRIMEEYINIVLSCVKDEMSILEKIKEVYDFIKLLEFDENGSTRIPDIIINRKTNSLGFSLLFSEILKRIGINSYISEVDRENKREYITLIDIEDEKYGATGIYCFDPASDSIPRDVYKSDAIRKVNYNYFALTLDQVVDTKFADKLGNTLALLVADSLEFSSRKIDSKTKKKLEEVFDCCYYDLYEKIKKTKRIDEEKLLNLFISTVHDEDFLGLNRNVNELLRNNYTLRKKEIFNCDSSGEIKTISIHDI